ncbi:MAG: Sodium-dependent dicarboxylate transporter SdcS [Candidatus Dichloromethanomonas elyunquensis]|nr:MAG: Sodium-dependent dicarboxylate transporter SdcS [Candidatus Dichloromethanomonas elyunquensis]
MKTETIIGNETNKKFSLNAKNALIFLIAVAVMMIVYWLPSPAPLHKGTEAIPLTFAGKAVLGVLFYAVILWMTEAIPFSVTAISLLIILHMMGVSTFAKMAQTGMGSSVLFFILGALGISAALGSSGLAKRIMYFVLSKVGTKTDRIVLAFIGIGTVLSMFVTDLAVAAMMVPLAVSILKNAGCKPLESNFGRALMIGVVYGALIGGTATPAGCGPNILAMDFVRRLAGMNVTFGQWMAVGVPGAILMAPVGWFILMKLFPPEIKEIPLGLDEVKKDLKGLGALSRKEINTIIVFFIAVGLWLGGPFLKAKFNLNIPEDYVAILAFFLLFLPGLRVFDSWQDVKKELDLGALLLIGCGIAAGTLLADTGAARYIAWGMLSGIGSMHPVLRVLAVISLVELLKIFFSSNSVTGAVVMPLVIALALDLKMNPWVVAGPAGIAASMAFIMVTSSPTNVVPYSAGYFSIKDYAKAGVLMTIAAIIIVTISVAIFGRFAGMNIWM